MNPRETANGWYILKSKRHVKLIENAYYDGVYFVLQDGSTLDFSDLEYFFPKEEGL
jgi:hypothetical protein